MEFEKARVYTAVNADELKVGSKVICGNTLIELQKNVRSAEDIKHLKRINDEFVEYRFYCGADSYSLAYLVEAPKEKEYDEFKIVDDAMAAIKKHGGWIKHKTEDITLLVCGYSDAYIYTLRGNLSLNHLFAFYVFADDGSPCGELEE